MQTTTTTNKEKAAQHHHLVQAGNQPPVPIHTNVCAFAQTGKFCRYGEHLEPTRQTQTQTDY